VDPNGLEDNNDAPVRNTDYDVTITVSAAFVPVEPDDDPYPSPNVICGLNADGVFACIDNVAAYSQAVIDACVDFVNEDIENAKQGCGDFDNGAEVFGCLVATYESQPYLMDVCLMNSTGN
jgi:hypothetical protein